MTELVTAVITTYKREPEIVERALKSVLAQTYPNMEVFVVDDSPADYPLRTHVADIVKKYKEHGVVYVPHEINKGACAARNTGLELAKGKFIAYLDDDDEWLPEKTEKQLAAFQENSIGLVYCDSIVLNQQSGKKEYTEREQITENAAERLLSENCVGGASVPLIRTDALREIGGFDTRLQAVQDRDAWLRLAEKYRIKHVKEYLVRYYIHPGEQITYNPQKRVAGVECFVEKYQHHLDANRYACWRNYMKLAWDNADAGNKKKALCLWSRYLWKCPLQIKENIRYLYVILR